jgi:hypothetical protein
MREVPRETGVIEPGQAVLMLVSALRAYHETR